MPFTCPCGNTLYFVKVKIINGLHKACKDEARSKKKVLRTNENEALDTFIYRMLHKITPHQRLLMRLEYTLLKLKKIHYGYRFYNFCLICWWYTKQEAPYLLYIKY